MSLFGSGPRRQMTPPAPTEEVGPTPAQELCEALFDTEGSRWSHDEKARWLADRYGTNPIPVEIVDAAIAHAGTRGPQVIGELAAIRGQEMLPWIDPLLQSTRLDECARAAIGLLQFDTVSGLRECRRIFLVGSATPTNLDHTGYNLHWICDALEAIADPCGAALAIELRKIDAGVIPRPVV